MARTFTEQGIRAVVIDDLSSGHREFVSDKTPFVGRTILDTDLLRRTLRANQVTGGRRPGDPARIVANGEHAAGIWSGG